MDIKMPTYAYVYLLECRSGVLLDLAVTDKISSFLCTYVHWPPTFLFLAGPDPGERVKKGKRVRREVKVRDGEE
jgi:hypothetical protein